MSINSGDDAIDWREAYQSNAGDLFTFLARRVGWSLAEDLLADTFTQAMGSASGGFDPSRGTVRLWLFGIASNLVRRHWRTEERRLRAIERDAAMPPVAVDPLLVPAAAADRLHAEGEIEALVDELSRLDPVDRELLALTGWESMTSAEAGAALGLSAVTVRTRVRRARARLRAATERPVDVNRAST
ncbi:MAG: sigma-70 family RNA polymerase sigma factor [Actinomycetota bacterium]